jgi:hypothetical protein
VRLLVLEAKSKKIHESARIMESARTPLLFEHLEFVQHRQSTQVQCSACPLQRFTLFSLRAALHCRVGQWSVRSQAKGVLFFILCSGDAYFYPISERTKNEPLSADTATTLTTEGPARVKPKSGISPARARLSLCAEHR